ncbi:cytochrome P450 [Streptomyces sp. WZ-12]|uniref:cytochrome P450 n=1 Tax=Streptomyces sp. WZ-12 TaxID=3030210 RepID=UPI002380FD31|nr:cytochrome P450 [Streptomyces sp. WZ-12]
MTGPDSHATASRPCAQASLPPLGSPDPWPGYAALLACPGLHYERVEHTYYAARHSDVHHGLRHPDLAVGFPFRATRQLFGPTAIDLDAPRHRPARQQVSWFTTRHMPTWTQSAVIPVIDDLIERAVTDTPVDVIKTFAQPLPTRVICRILGLPDHEWPWIWRQLRPVIGHIADQTTGMQAALASRDILADRLRHAVRTGVPHGSLLQRLCADVPPDSAVDRSAEPIRTALLLLAAGTETTAAAIGNLLWCLQQHPHTWDEVANGTIPADAVVTESLRLHPPLHSTVRFARRALTLGDTAIPKGARVQLLLAAANRDPARIGAPPSWNPHRSPQAHHAFGGGPHACVGAQLALTELQFLLTALARRFELAGPTHPASHFRAGPFHYPTELPVRLIPRTTPA